MFQDINDETKQRFKKAVRTLRLDVEHTHIVIDTEKPCFDLDASQEVPGWIGVENIKIVEGNGKEDEDDKDDSSIWDEDRLARRIEMAREASIRIPLRYETICMDCGGNTCYGTLKNQDPELMMLGSGELDALSTY